VPADVRKAILISLGASTLRASANFLLQVFSEESGELAAQALTALGASRFRSEIRDAVKALVESKADSELSRIFAKKFAE
jgi:hypothetical protein